MTEAFNCFLSIGNNLNEAVLSNMFGKPCFKINGKAFVCFLEQDMVFKLNGDAHTEALSLDGSTLADPSKKNRPMKEWVQVPYHYHALWPKFAAKALKYVASLMK